MISHQRWPSADELETVVPSLVRSSPEKQGADTKNMKKSQQIGLYVESGIVWWGFCSTMSARKMRESTRVVCSNTVTEFIKPSFGHDF